MVNVKWLFILTMILFLTSNISATCEENQIDINTASLGELDKIAQIGPARAEQMITLRPFTSVDDMIRIIGIGETNINLIKSQGLACVADEKIEEEAVNNEENASVKSNVSVTLEDTNLTNLNDNSYTKNIQLETITIPPKVIKSNENSLNLNKSDYAIYGLFAFAILLMLLFLIKRKKN